MAEAKAERWLTESFRDGVDERQPPGGIRLRPAYPGAYPSCWLAHHDERRRPCVGELERFHFLGRQRVERVLGGWLPTPELCERCFGTGERDPRPERRMRIDVADEELCPACWGDGLDAYPPRPLVLLAAWDPRNGGVGCEGHHRRFDSHLTPTLVVPRSAIPAHVFDFGFQYGLEDEILDRFPAD